MWSGAVDAIPNGWTLCNGQNNTPDLKNRFIVGAGDEYSVGDVGGVKEYETDYQNYTSGSILDYFRAYPSSGTYATINNRPPYYALCYIMKQ